MPVSFLWKVLPVPPAKNKKPNNLNEMNPCCCKHWVNESEYKTNKVHWLWLQGNLKCFWVQMMKRVCINQNHLSVCPWSKSFFFLTSTSLEITLTQVHSAFWREKSFLQFFHMIMYSIFSAAFLKFKQMEGLLRRYHNYMQLFY